MRRIALLALTLLVGCGGLSVAPTASPPRQAITSEPSLSQGLAHRRPPCWECEFYWKPRDLILHYRRNPKYKLATLWSKSIDAEGVGYGTCTASEIAIKDGNFGRLNGLTFVQ